MYLWLPLPLSNPKNGKKGPQKLHITTERKDNGWVALVLRFRAMGTHNVSVCEAIQWVWTCSGTM